MKSGTQLIADQRALQLETGEITEEHDNQHALGQLSEYATYCIDPQTCSHKFPDGWDEKLRETPVISKNITNLINAGAYIAAEIDRLQRL